MITKFKTERLGFIEDQYKLNKLFHIGLIDNHGDPIPFRPGDEDDMK